MACLITVSGIIAAGTNTITEVSRAQATPTPTPGLNLYGETKAMPAELAYWVLFQEIQALKEKDIESSAQGETTTFKNSFYANRLGLESSQFAAIDSAANECLTNLQPVDQRAREVINQYRSQFPNGELKKPQPSTIPNHPQRGFEALPPVPTELSQLQTQRNQIILNAKEKIKQSLGQTEFADFDLLVQKNATKVLIPLNLDKSALPPLTPTPTPGN